MGDAFKAVGAFIAKNWQVLALIAFIVFFFLSKNDYGALKKSMEVMTVSYQEQLENVKRLHQQELKLREESIAKYEKEIADLTRKYDEALENLQKSKEEDIKRIERDFEEQPDQLAEEIEDQYGFSYVK
jgi:F0F1-type ATP synthase membrane subunit b/b'